MLGSTDILPSQHIFACTIQSTESATTVSRQQAVGAARKGVDEITQYSDGVPFRLTVNIRPTVWNDMRFYSDHLFIVGVGKCQTVYNTLAH